MAINDAVAPPSLQPLTPVQTSAVAPVPMVVAPEPDIHDSYLKAVDSGDPAEMTRVAQAAKGTPVELLADTAVKIMGANDTRLSQITAPVIKAGGINTPEGRIAASKVFEDQADKPQWLRAIGEKLMGNPDARLFITGGTPKTVITYDDQGGSLMKVIQQNGQSGQLR